MAVFSEGQLPQPKANNFEVGVHAGSVQFYQIVFFLEEPGSMPVTYQLNASCHSEMEFLSNQSIFHLGTVMIWNSTTVATVILTRILY